ncbi:MAG TPA: hypothetical protein PKD90_11485, partial [Phnomibacter sp.]|nr:hypothetical protein [Phnomibacter sp.]
MGGNGVYGSAAAAASAGVRGQSTNGAGVLGYSNNNLGVSAGTLGGTALFASAIGGTALKSTSSSGYRLDVSGKVKIAGGNTNPSAGAVLTSTDANGNAVWKPTMKIAFSANGSLNKSIPNGGQQKVEFNSELYDLNNNFVPNSGSVNAGSSVFTAPVAGIYHFSTDLVLCMSSIVHNFNYGIIYLKRNGSTIASANGIINNGSASSSVYLHIDGDFNLAANDKVWIEVYQSNGG